MSHSRPTNGRRQSSRRGTVATEFAIVVPVLLLIALACVDFGRIATFSEVLSNAARSGAEVGGTRRFTSDTEPMWRAKVYEAATQEMQSVSNFQPADFGVQVSTTIDSADVTRVTVDATYTFRTLVSWPGLPSEVPLREVVQYRQFR